MNKLIRFWGDLRSSFWFLPFLIVLSSIIYAIALIRIDRAGSDRWLGQWPQIFGVGAEGAREMLSTLAGSMMTVMGITFSMTLLALTLASSQYSSRVLRNFMRSRVTQVTLGTFAGIFVYCLIVMHTIRTVDAPFVPSVAVFFAFLLALGGIAVLIFFIHHIASSIQASNIIASVAQDTYVSIDRLLPKKLDHEPDEYESRNQVLESLDERVWYPVPVAVSGYIQSVDYDALLQLAEDSRTIVRMEHGIGAFVVQDTALVSLALTYPPDQKIIDALNGAYSIGRNRLVEQDPAFGIRQIVDIAIKALSPGINDTSTAVMCVDYLAAILARLAGRQFPPVQRYEGETLRVIAIVPSFEGLLAESFDQIRANAEVNVAILARILSAFDSIGSLTFRDSHLRALNEQLQCIAELANRCIKSSHDSARLKKRLSEVRETLKAQSALCAAEDKG
ncbi:conserved hypothetical protein [Psychromonas ingrahamii 37]|uniref:DUF2254 domain-containing protein n=1 Tax=Psychromonas ingrahamii (strain DSM 17664 / CCUG 51855 / 37) TaxID=357804 RepID=A1SY25_PSYIN|nr:DUF2254 domain-containing protein [Psychromonas ingrahamii]ABM04390.1 conserved hypothetical protein [Psychromonas ingrahamii 37]